MIYLGAGKWKKVVEAEDDSWKWKTTTEDVAVAATCSGAALATRWGGGRGEQHPALVCP
jgi:hypothetical protein